MQKHRRQAKTLDKALRTLASALCNSSTRGLVVEPFKFPPALKLAKKQLITEIQSNSMQFMAVLNTIVERRNYTIPEITTPVGAAEHIIDTLRAEDRVYTNIYQNLYWLAVQGESRDIITGDEWNKLVNKSAWAPLFKAVAEKRTKIAEALKGAQQKLNKQMIVALLEKIASNTPMQQKLTPSEYRFLNRHAALAREIMQGRELDQIDFTKAGRRLAGARHSYGFFGRCAAKSPIEKVIAERVTRAEQFTKASIN